MGVFYVTSAGSLVVSVPDHSPLFGHVSTGDVLLRVGKFDVVNGGQSFRSAVEDLIRSNDSVGFCVGKTRTQEMDITKGACCEKGFQKTNTQASLQCFRTTEEDKKGFCLNPSLISMRPTCRVSADCKGGLLPSLKQGSEGFIGAGRQVSVSDGMEKMKGVKDDICLLAELPNNQQLVDLRVRAAENGNIMHVFYQGYGKIVGSMTVSSYVPRLWRWMPTWLLEMVAMLDFPNMTERFLQYFASVSLALGLLNMAPVLYLDGEASSRLFLQMACGSRKANPSLNRGIVMLGTSLLLANVAHALWKITKLV